MYRTSHIYSSFHRNILVNYMTDENQDRGEDLKELNLLYDELSQDARTIARDLEWGQNMGFLLGFYSLVLGVSVDFYVIYSGYLWTMDYYAWFGFLLFNLFTTVAGGFMLYKAYGTHQRYKKFYRLENKVRMKEYSRKKKDGD